MDVNIGIVCLYNISRIYILLILVPYLDVRMDLLSTLEKLFHLDSLLVVLVD